MSQELKVNTKTKINSFEDTQRALQDIQKNFNILVDKVASPAEKELSETTGTTGDIQITRNKDKTYTFEVRTEDGWKTPVLGDSVIHFKGKPKTFSKEQDKSLTEIKADDSSTGDTGASNTIYDEKNKKFVMPQPDFDSDWFAGPAESGSSVIPHGLTEVNGNEANILYTVYMRNTSDPDTATKWKIKEGADVANDRSYAERYDVGYDATNFYITNDTDETNSSVKWGVLSGTTAFTSFDSIHVRIKAWYI